jgi:hypothetical protein
MPVKGGSLRRLPLPGNWIAFNSTAVGKPFGHV